VREGQGQGGGVPCDASFQGVAAERGAAAGGKQRVGGQAAALSHPGFQDNGGPGGQRRYLLATAFAQAADASAGAKVSVADGQPGQF